MYMSTLQDFVKALGGELKITAEFPEGPSRSPSLGTLRKQPLARNEAGFGFRIQVAPRRGPLAATKVTIPVKQSLSGTPLRERDSLGHLPGNVRYF